MVPAALGFAWKSSTSATSEISSSRSSIVCTASDLYRTGRSEHRGFETYSMLFDTLPCDEREFVEAVTTEGGVDFAPPAERIAVFDNDGTLWSEQPIYFQLLSYLAHRFQPDAPPVTLPKNAFPLIEQITQLPPTTDAQLGFFIRQPKAHIPIFQPATAVFI